MTMAIANRFILISLRSPPRMLNIGWRPLTMKMILLIDLSTITIPMEEVNINMLEGVPSWLSLSRKSQMKGYHWVSSNKNKMKRRRILIFIRPKIHKLIQAKFKFLNIIKILSFLSSSKDHNGNLLDNLQIKIANKNIMIKVIMIKYNLIFLELN